MLYDIEYDEAGHIIGKHKYTKGISADVGSSTVKGYANEITDSIIEPTGEATLNNYIKRLWNKINSLEQRIAVLESNT
nr:MAG TPA: shock protein B [Caudoviricetes sp.]